MSCENCGAPDQVEARKVYRLNRRPMATRIPLCAGCWEGPDIRAIVRHVLEARIKP